MKKVLGIASIVLLANVGKANVIVENAAFHGKNCTNEDLATKLPAKLDSLKFKFANFRAGKSRFATCKITLSIHSPKGRAFSFDSADVTYKNLSNSASSAKIYANLSSSAKMLNAIPYPIIASVPPDSTQAYTLRKLGSGRQVSYCYGETMTYQLQLTLVPRKGDGQSEESQISIAELNNITYKAFDCSNAGGAK